MRSGDEVLRGYERWPTWMWANEEVADLIRWLRAHNADPGAEMETFPDAD